VNPPRRKRQNRDARVGRKAPYVKRRARTTLSIGGPVTGAAVTLRVIGDAVNVSLVSRMFGRRPSGAWSKGEIIRTKSRRQYLAPTGVWNATIEGNRAEPLSRTIARLLRSIPAQPRVFREMGRRFKLDVLCGVFLDDYNRGFELPAILVQSLARRGLALSFDIYAPNRTLRANIAAAKPSRRR
jgi:hypothetical protein